MIIYVEFSFWKTWRIENTFKKLYELFRLFSTNHSYAKHGKTVRRDFEAIGKIILCVTAISLSN